MGRVRGRWVLAGREHAWAERGEAGGAGPSWAGPFGLEEEVGRAGLVSGFLGWFSFSNSNSISYFYFKQSLNSNHTQTIKTMHQHECNTKI